MTTATTTICPQCGRPMPADAVGGFCPACLLTAALNHPANRRRTLPLTRKRLLHYQLLEQIGEGGMGVVYKARDTRLDRFVAIKVLPADKVDDPERRRRFIHEAKAASALNHPNIVTIHEVAVASGVHFIAMEFIEGRTLDRLIGARGLPPDQVLLYAIPIAGALARAHEAGIVHRDLKPQNIMVRDDGLVKLLDFGLAKLVEADAAGDSASEFVVPPSGGALSGPDRLKAELRTQASNVTLATRIAGTPGYMAPEQIEGRKIDGRADLFAFGAVLYHALSGKKPFARDSAAATLAAILHDEPPPLVNVPAALATIVTRCLGKNPADRFATAAELQAALRGLTTAASDEKPDPSIAVLPFANLGGQPDDDYFGDALSGEIITALARIPGLKVTGRTSSLMVAAERLEPREIGARLGVAHLLEGSVQHTEQTLHVAARLVRVADGSCLWAESYDRTPADIFAVQDGMAQSVASRLGLHAQSRARTGRPTENLEAYHHFLLGRHAFDRSDLSTAREQFERAVQLDPGFALAYDALAEVWWFLGFWGYTTMRNAVAQGVWAALRALEIDDQLADTHAQVAMFRWVSDFNLAAVKREFQRAQELAPNSPKVRFRFGWVGLLPHGRLEEACTVFEAVLSTDPLSGYVRVCLASTLQMRRQHEAAIALCRQIIAHEPEMAPAYLVLGMSLEWLDRRSEARVALRTFAELTQQSAHALGLMGWLHARAGEIAAARQLLAELEQRARSGYVPPSAPAWVLMGLGEIDAAVEWIDRGIDVSDPMIIALKPWGVYDPVREHPRYPQLLRRMNIEP